jgi:hypothetical protein
MSFRYAALRIESTKEISIKKSSALSLPDPFHYPLPRIQAVVEIKPFLGSPDGGGAFKGGSHLIVALIGGENAIYSDGYYGFVTVTKAKADRSDLPIGVCAGNHLYGRIKPKIRIYHGKLLSSVSRIIIR